MKRLLSLFSFLFVFCSISIQAQSPKHDMKQNKIFFCQFNSTEIQILKKHWRQYFTQNIYPSVSKLPTSNYHPVFLDSYGGVYPEEQIYPDDFDFCWGSKKDKNLLRYSHYNNIRWNPDLKSQIGSKTGFNFNNITFHKKRSKRKAFKNEVDEFYQNWNEFFLPKTIESIKSKLGNKRHIVFFIHGYNVPYSLAVVQSIVMFNQLKSEGLDTDNTLLIPIFWTSNDQKNNEIECDGSFNVRDDRNIKNVGKWLHYSNRAYYASITLRKLLFELTDCVMEDSIDVMIIAHSLGATIATSSCINTNQKLQNGEISDDISSKLKAVNIPEYKIKMFLSAPAIPGVNTFVDMDNRFSNKIVFSTINEHDVMVGKFGLFATKLSSTSLGSNYHQEANTTKALFTLRGFYNNFLYRNVSERKDHDIFTYLRQDEYTKFLNAFLAF